MSINYYSDIGPLTNAQIDANFKQCAPRNAGNTASANNMTLTTGYDYYVITGTTEIQTIANEIGSDSIYGQLVRFKFTGTPNLKHSASLILPGATDIQTVAGDVATFVNESAGVWRLVNYTSGSLEYATTTQATVVTGTVATSFDWAHGLGTDDIDFGGKVSFSIAQTGEVKLQDPNDFVNILYDDITTVQTGITSPASGSLRCHLYSTVGQTLTVHLWARKR